MPNKPQNPIFPTREFQIVDIKATVEHLGESLDEFPPHDTRDWWKITIHAPESGLEYVREVGGSRDEYERRRSLRKKKEWGAGPLEQVIYDLNRAAEDPDEWYEFEVDESERSRKHWDPRQKDYDAVAEAKAFIAVAEQFDGIIQPAFWLWQEDWQNIVSESKEV